MFFISILGRLNTKIDGGETIPPDLEPCGKLGAELLELKMTSSVRFPYSSDSIQGSNPWKAAKNTFLTCISKLK
jgi:hypothetical protein